MAVVPELILFGSKTWILTPWLEKAITGFCQCAERWMAGMGPKRQPYRTWVYLPIGEALAMVVLEEIRVYISCRQNMVAQYIATFPIMYLCLAE